MIRRYGTEDVYEALQRRLEFIFEEFDNIYLSFSGGKDSGLLLNLRRSYIGYVFLWRQGQRLVVMKCSGILGMIRKRRPG